MIIVDVDQGSEEWLELRRSKITATDVAKILGLNPWESPLSPYLEKLALKDPEPENDKMREGKIKEKEALIKFNEFIGITLNIQPIVALSEEFTWALASLDGISLSKKVAVEIKCGEKSYYQSKKGIIPPYYYAQMQHQMMVCGLDKIFYFCYFNGDDILIEVERDEEFISQMIPRLQYYYNCLINWREPSLDECTIGPIRERRFNVIAKTNRNSEGTDLQCATGAFCPAC